MKRAAYTHMPALVARGEVRRSNGEPTIVPRRRIIAFEVASELKQALESKRLRLT